MSSSIASPVLEIISLVSSLASLLLAFTAIALAVYFYTRSKEAEAAVGRLLSEIKQQTTTLERLSGRLISKLTAAVTSPRPMDEATKALIDKLEGGTAADQLKVGHAGDRTLDLKIISFYYAATTNLASQSYLPPSIGDLSEGEPIRAIIDRSASDYRYFDAELKGHMEEIKDNYFFPSYQEAVGLRQAVKDTVGVYRDRESSADVPDLG